MTPEPPQTESWVTLLHWSIIAMSPDDPELSFVASLLHHAIDRPAKWASRIVDHLTCQYHAGQLGRKREDVGHSLAIVRTAGRA